MNPHQLVDDGVDVPVRQVRCARQYGLEALPDERAQVALQQRGKSGLLLHLRAFRPEPAPAFEAGPSVELPAAEVIPACLATYASRIARASAGSGWACPASSLLKRSA